MLARSFNGLGSSPLTRGKRRAPALLRFICRLIPAHAGKTWRSRTRAGSAKAHPRSRGENHHDRTVASLIGGSSPLTRGKLGDREPARGARRLIPAHAGKTLSPSGGRVMTEAHPRSRGENTPSPQTRMAPHGSSPLTRGKRVERRARPPSRGLIPAHAGKTSRVDAGAARPQAHPRSRGENEGREQVGQANAGSSPLTRGKLIALNLSKSAGRLIPAHAGKTGRTRRRVGSRRAHPRSRGENVFRQALLEVDNGSSPLTRGKP